MKNPSNTAVVIGGGFYGLSIALFLVDELKFEDVTILEKEKVPMSRASYVNQARVHAGYHYPRSMLTGYRSAFNFPRFAEEYKGAIVSDFTKNYAISKQLSKVNARQFEAFCRKIGVDIEKAPAMTRALFNQKLTEEIFVVKEYAFNSFILRDLLLERIKKHPSIKVEYGKEVTKIEEGGDGIVVHSRKETYGAANVFNCTYSGINNLHRSSNIPLIAVKHEIAEMCLVKLPEALKDFSITVMDGPFFSIMPFPTKPGLHTLSHVRYTPHESWIDDETTAQEKRNPDVYFKSRPVNSHYRQMYADVVRFIPKLKDMEYVESISEVKTTLVKSEEDDSRPILFKPNFGIKGYTCIMGGKLDNIYDVFDELEGMYGQAKKNA